MVGLFKIKGLQWCYLLPGKVPVFQHQQSLCRFASSSGTRYQLDLLACQQFILIIFGMTCKVRTGKQNIPFLFLVTDNCSHFSSDELIKPRQRYKKYSFYPSYWIKKCWFYSIRWIEWIKSVLLFLIFQFLSILLF